MSPSPSSTASKNGTSANGRARYQQDKVRVAIVGVGNCASAFVQGVEHYRKADPNKEVPGLMHTDLGGYHVSDIEFTCAFDINRTKVGKDLGKAIWADPNNTMKFAKVPAKIGAPVYRGMTLDGIGKYAKEKIKKAPGETADIATILRETRTDVVVSYLPVGSEDATRWYVEQVLEAGCGFVNCIPVFIASSDYWGRKFKKAGLPIIGDDIKSQVGATIIHRTRARLVHDRGVKIIGATAHALATRRFRIESFVSPEDLTRHLIGAMLMGAGGVTALGCTIGQGVTGISTLAAGSFITLAAILAGCAGMLKFDEWRLMRT